MKVFSRRNLILFLAVSALVIGLYVWSRVDSSLASVKVARATVGDLAQSFRTNGVVEPVEFREIRAEFAGQVLAVLVREGDRVRAGQALARLDGRDAGAELAQARSQLLGAQQAVAKIRSGGARNHLEAEIAQTKADLVLAESNRRRDEILLKQRAISQLEFDESCAAYNKAFERLAALERERDLQVQQLDRLSEEEANARVEQAQVLVQNAQARLKAIAVPAPLAGTVLVAPPRPGTLFSVGDLLAKVGNIGRLQVRAFIDQPDFSSIQVGSPLRITSNGFPGETWHGSVTSLSAELKTLGKRVVGEALCAMEDGRDQLPVNSNVDLTFTSRELHGALLLPVDAVLQRENHNYVYVVKGGVLHLREVQVGASNSDSVVVRSGLEPNEVVLNDLGVQPREGLRVVPR